jgi:hypothetical protein
MGLLGLCCLKTACMNGHFLVLTFFEFIYPVAKSLRSFSDVQELDMDLAWIWQINDRYEFPLQLDLDRENGKYLSPDADRSVRNLYTLHRFAAISVSFFVSKTVYVSEPNWY